MELPKLPYGGGAYRKETVAFGGLNYAQGAQEGELAESMGLSARAFPALSQRGKREEVSKCMATGNGIFAWGKLIVVDGTRLLYDGEQVGTVSDGKKEFAVVGTRLCIFPDKKCLDLENKKFTGLEEVRTSEVGAVSTFTGNTLKVKGRPTYGHQRQLFPDYAYIDPEYGLTYYDHRVKVCSAASFDATTKKWTLTNETIEIPSSVKVGQYFVMRKSKIDGNFSPCFQLTQRYEGTESTIVTYGDYNTEGYFAVVTAVDVDPTPNHPYTNISFTVMRDVTTDVGLSASFRVGDRVSIEGAVKTENNKEHLAIRAITDADTHSTLTFDDNTFTMTAGATQVTQTEVVTVKRAVPDLAFICESGNRLWGCEGHTIWASALGDPYNFHQLGDLSTNSYAVAVGTDGPFTGCVAYSDNVLFFKEQCLHKVMGAFPAEYAVYTYNVEGVQRGSHKSVAIHNEVLYYKGRSGVYAFTGGTPQCISAALGNRRFGQAVGGCDDTHYYLSMEEAGGGWGLFTHHIQSRLWLKEDESQMVGFANLAGVLHGLAQDGRVLRLEQGDDPSVAWSATLVPFRDDTMEKKRNLRLSLRLSLGVEATVLVEVREDFGPWQRAWQTASRRFATHTIPLRPQRCDQLEVRISGVGRCLVHGLVREVQVTKKRGG